MKHIILTNNWRLHEAPLFWNRDALSRVSAFKDGWMECSIPCDIHMPLEAYGKIKNVVVGMNSFDARWTENRSWWFMNEFDSDGIDLDADVIELTMESLDACADIFLNGEWLGTHKNAHRPFVKGVKNLIRPGKNVLAVRMTSGLENVTDEMLSDLNWACCTEDPAVCPERGDKRRSWLRKPQYCVGWDWGPRCVTCGIVKPVYIRSYNRIAVRGVHVVTEEFNEGNAGLHITVEADQLSTYSSFDGDVKLVFTLNEKSQVFEKKDILLTSGINYIDMDVEIENAKLWWPAGCGEQPLYDVDVSVTVDGITDRYPSFQYGIRKISLDTSRTDDRNRNFFLSVNGVRIFCKGGNWIPADSVYARITDEKYNALISEAKSANFNMLRVWGGGIYEPDVFYEACDREGILIWHDFMFSCTTVPDHIDWFRRECLSEMNNQTARLRNHACMALWCGSNEQHMIYNDAHGNRGLYPTYEKQYGLFQGNTLGKIAVRANCPEIPYWNSSPYGGTMPNDDNVGDVHHWHACMMNPDMNKRISPAEYDKVQARFVSEYGYPGPCCAESIREYLGTDEIDRTSRVWDEHNNTFEKKTVAAGIEKHYPVDAARLSLDEYILYAGMTQSLMLGYSLEAIRFKDFCGGGLFWMYNDTWGEVGWTIVDYYLRRKISFYGVKRAFAPVKLTLRPVNGKARLQAVNDTDTEITLNAKIGLLSLNGKEDLTSPIVLTLPAHCREYIGDFDLPEADYMKYAFVILPEDGCDPAVLRLHDSKDLSFTGSKPKIIGSEKVGKNLTVTLTADAFIHGVHIKENLRMSDNYFDLLPGQIKKVTIEDADECPEWYTVM